MQKIPVEVSQLCPGSVKNSLTEKIEHFQQMGLPWFPDLLSENQRGESADES